MQTPVFFVVGPVGHGKTTCREILSRLTHLKGGSCSDVIYHFLAIRKQTSVDALRALPKEQLRPELIEAGDFLCGAIGEVKEIAKNETLDAEVYRHPSAIIRTLYLNGYNVIDGVRRRLELADAKQHLDWNGVPSLVLHVENPRAARIADNSEDLREMSDEQVVNDGTPEELELKLRAIVDRRFGSQGPAIDPADIEANAGSVSVPEPATAA